MGRARTNGAADGLDPARGVGGRPSWEAAGVSLSECCGRHSVGQGSPRSSRWQESRSTSSWITAPPAKKMDTTAPSRRRVRSGRTPPLAAASMPRCGRPAPGRSQGGMDAARRPWRPDRRSGHPGRCPISDAAGGEPALPTRSFGAPSQRKRFSMQDEALLPRADIASRHRGTRASCRIAAIIARSLGIARAQLESLRPCSLRPSSRSISAPQAASFSVSRS